MAYTDISYDSLTAGSWATVYTTACSTTYTYAPPIQDSSEDDAEESALDWLDRRVEEMRVTL